MTEKEKVQLQRKAYADGLYESGKFGAAEADELAAERYPMPTRSIPRVVGMILKSGDYVEYKFVPGAYAWGKFYYRVPTMDWQVLDCIYPEGFTAENLRLLADLMADPYVEVEIE